jgi:hypothetical protein
MRCRRHSRSVTFPKTNKRFQKLTRLALTTRRPWNKGKAVAEEGEAIYPPSNESGPVVENKRKADAEEGQLGADSVPVGYAGRRQPSSMLRLEQSGVKAGILPAKG